MTRSQDHVAAINSALRQAGHPVHCTWLSDPHDLGDALTQLNPHMLVAFTDEPGMDFRVIMSVRTQNAPEMPVLIVRQTIDEAAIADAMRQGAEDAVTLADRDRLQAVATRELRTYRRARELLATLAAAREYREQLQDFVERSADAIAHVQEGIVVDANRAWLELLGHSGDDSLGGTPLMDLFETQSHPALKGALVACLQGKWTDHALKVRALRGDGSRLALAVTLTRADYDGEPATRITIPTRHKKALDPVVALAHPSQQDAFHVMQQRHLVAALRERCSVPVKGGVRRLACLKPDRFSDIQRAIGLLASEDFLAQLAELLRVQLLATDVCGRFGGNVFLILLERGTPRDVEAWAETVVHRVREHTFKIGEKTLSATVTVGLRVMPTAHPDVDAAVTDAVGAMRSGRELGGNQVYAVDNSDTDARLQAYEKICVRQIKTALMDNRFRLVRQPMISLLGQDQIMFDVLCRMLDERGTEVLPAEFMAAAERNDLMKNIDRWVLGASMSFAANRAAECIFVRVSKDTLLDPSVIGWLGAQLMARSIEPGRLCIQVTEETANQYVLQTAEFAGSLRKLGLRFALEHFGIGPDPQKRLADIGMDFIKIDGSLMQGLSSDQPQQQRVRDLVEAAKRKGVETVAERVEDANTMAVLWQLGIEFVQGHFVNPPETVTLSGER
jgi:diguanylate cyclase (GGDEF)-like protein/PAS domain S-box-containing protein